MTIQNLGLASLNLADLNSALDYVSTRQVSDWGGNLGTSRVSGVAFYLPILSPALVAANTTAEQTFTVNGLVAGQAVIVNKPTAQAGLGIVGCRVSTNNTLAITFSNNTAAGITPTASQAYIVVAIWSA